MLSRQGKSSPSKRSFARHLGVSLITVEGAYSQLIAEGYLRAEPRRGYFACDLNSSGVVSGRKPSLLGVGSSSLETAYPTDVNLLPEEGLAQAYASLAAAGRPREGRIDAGGQSSTSANPSGKNSLNGEAVFADFTGSSVPLGMFPYAAWAKSLRDALTRESERMLVGETGFAGALRLRKAIADHLRGFRGMEVDPECIVVGLVPRFSTTGSFSCWGAISIMGLKTRDICASLESMGRTTLSFRIFLG